MGAHATEGAAQAALPRIQILCVEKCPLVPQLRMMLESCLAEAKVEVKIEEVVGHYASPTLLVDGADVTGQKREHYEQMCCRLQLPTRQQIMHALQRN